jgi:CRP-like cAMP-binding protein
LRGAPADCVERFRQESRLLRVPAGRHLFDEQAACNAFPKCRRGRIRVSKLGPGGREITLYRVTPGESCVLTSGCLPGDMPYTATGIAETDIVLLAMFFVLEANARWLGLIGLVPSLRIDWRQYLPRQAVMTQSGPAPWSRAFPRLRKKGVTHYATEKSKRPRYLTGPFLVVT